MQPNKYTIHLFSQIFTTHYHKKCELTLLESDTGNLPANCDVGMTMHPDTFFIPLQETTGFLFSTQAPTNISINCNNNYKEIITIKNMGTILLITECVIIHETSTYKSVSRNNNNRIYTRKPMLDITKINETIFQKISYLQEKGHDAFNDRSLTFQDSAKLKTIQQDFIQYHQAESLHINTTISLIIMITVNVTIFIGGGITIFCLTKQSVKEVKIVTRASIGTPVLAHVPTRFKLVHFSDPEQIPAESLV